MSQDHDHIEFTSEVEYQAARAAIDAYETWRAGRSSVKTADIPADLAHVDNAMRSAVEVWEFKAKPPLQYFLYVTYKPGAGDAHTWTGQHLGRVHFGAPYRVPDFGGFPSTRVPVTVYAINGAVYVGTYFKSSGDYARVRMTADSRRKLGLDKAAA